MQRDEEEATILAGRGTGPRAQIYKDAPADLLRPLDPDVSDIKAELLRRLDLAREYFALSPPPSPDHEHRQWALIDTVFPNALRLASRLTEIRERQKEAFADWADAHRDWRTTGRKELVRKFPKLAHVSESTIANLISKGRGLRKKRAERTRLWEQARMEVFTKSMPTEQVFAGFFTKK
jgi:hypothetical protein